MITTYKTIYLAMANKEPTDFFIQIRIFAVFDMGIIWQKFLFVIFRK